MSAVIAWRFKGNQINIGSNWYYCACTILFDTEKCTKDKAVGRCRYGYFSNAELAGNAKLVTPTGTLTIGIDPYPNGAYFGDTDVNFSQNWNTSVNLSCSLSYTDSSGKVYNSKVSQTVKLIPPAPKTFDELNLTVNGVKLTKNLQVFTVDDIDTDIEISANVNDFAGSSYHYSRLNNVSFIASSLAPDFSVSLVSNGAGGGIDSGGPKARRITFNTTIREIFNLLRDEVPTVTDVSAEFNASKMYQLGLEKGWFMNEWNGVPEINLSKQFVEAGLYRAGYMPFTFVSYVSWGITGSMFYSGTPCYFTDGPSFVIAYGPFLKYKDDEGNIHSSKACIADGSSKMYSQFGAIVELNDGVFKDSSGVVRQIKNQGR